MVRRRRRRRWWRWWRWWRRRWRWWLADAHVVRHGSRRILVVGDGERHRVRAAGAVRVRRVLHCGRLPVAKVPGVAGDRAILVAAGAAKAPRPAAAVQRAA